LGKSDTESNIEATTMIATNKGKKLPPEPLTQEEVRALIGVCSKRAATGIRNRALLVVLYRAGLRISEALALLPKDFDASAGTLRVLHGKGDKSRVVGLDSGAAAILQNWLDKRATLGLGGRSPIFCTLAGEQIESAYIRALLPRLARKAGIEKRVHAHGLRHSHAAELANENVPMHVIQQQLGHSNVAVTSRYVAHLNPLAVVQTMQAREWSL
jgi:site-specific recombinase XerD